MIKCNRLYREEGIISWIGNAFLAYNSYSRLVCTLDIKHMSIYLFRINVRVLLSVDCYVLASCIFSWMMHMGLLTPKMLF